MTPLEFSTAVMAIFTLEMVVVKIHLNRIGF